VFRKLEDFFGGWAYESEATLKVFKELTDESLKQKVTPEGRSLGFLAWHITTALAEMGNKAGLNIIGVKEDEDEPNTADDIYKVYEKASKSVGEEVKKKWNDNILFDELEMYGQKWTRSQILSSLIGHQAHHRGQMTVLMRQAGLKVPGVYGPSKEEWAQFGMPTMK
jgi:uncharacterized damage-inducible protein DinB